MVGADRSVRDRAYGSPTASLRVWVVSTLSPEVVVMGMRRGSAARAAIVAAVAAAGFSAQSQADTRVTRDATPGSYVRYDGASDATMLSCSTGRRSQNEPSVAVDPRNPLVVVAGSNDYCAEIQNGSGNV
jgi:hypothetical protein